MCGYYRIPVKQEIEEKNLELDISSTECIQRDRKSFFFLLNKSGKKNSLSLEETGGRTRDN